MDSEVCWLFSHFFLSCPNDFFCFQLGRLKGELENVLKGVSFCLS